jgi:hypothetical protein
MKLAFSALAVAMVLSSASAALAAHHKARGLTANAQAGHPSDSKNPSNQDPRVAYKPKGSNHGTWCDNSADCNGWAQWLIEVQEGKLKADKNVYPLH